MPSGIQWKSESAPLASRSTRRRATVTMSEPLSASAAFMVGKSLYLPVPTMSRELSVRSPSLSASMSASSDERDDLHLVAFRERGLFVVGAPHHVLVALHRHAVARQAEALH